jgi:hypothetical protein
MSRLRHISPIKNDPCPRGQGESGGNEPFCERLEQRFLHCSTISETSRRAFFGSFLTNYQATEGYRMANFWQLFVLCL